MFLSMLRSPRFSVASILIAAIASVILQVAPSAANAAQATAGPVSIRSATSSRIITIDGQRVEVILDVASTGEGTTASRQTEVMVTLRTTDGRPLPQVTATRVRLERTRSPVRTFAAELIPVLTFRFDPTTSGTAAAGAPAFAPGTRLKGVVRLETAAGPRAVRFTRVVVQGR